VIAATWVWVLVGIVAFAGLGVAAVVVYGLLGTPRDLLRRGVQRAEGARVERGVELPTEVPDATASEVRDQVERDRGRE
jgi:hypothetical protein